jgi:hypothetical protein
VIRTGANDGVSQRVIDSCRILDTAGYGVEFVGPHAGYGSRITDCLIVPHTARTAAVRFANDAADAKNPLGGNRTMVNVFSASNPLVEFNGCDNAMIVGCAGGSPIFDDACRKVVMAGCRLSFTGQPLEIVGTQHSITGNVIAETDVIFGAHLYGAQVSGNVIATGGTVTDNASGVGTGNFIACRPRFFTPVWRADNANLSIGNGRLEGVAHRGGEMVDVNIQVTVGTDTVIAGNVWGFGGLPYAASRRQEVGSAILISTSGSGTMPPSVHPAVAAIAQGQTTVTLATGTGAYVGATVPFAWRGGDSIAISLRYAIR